MKCDHWKSFCTEGHAPRALSDVLPEALRLQQQLQQTSSAWSDECKAAVREAEYNLNNNISRIENAVRRCGSCNFAQPENTGC